MKNKVLLIDDSITIHRVIDLSIDQERYEITKVFSREDATPKIQNEKFDFILLDAKLDNINATEYIKELRISQPGAKILILVGNFDNFTEEQLSKIGADDYLVKPFSTQALNEKLTLSSDMMDANLIERMAENINVRDSDDFISPNDNLGISRIGHVEAEPTKTENLINKETYLENLEDIQPEDLTEDGYVEDNDLHESLEEVQKLDNLEDNTVNFTNNIRHREAADLLEEELEDVKPITGPDVEVSEKEYGENEIVPVDEIADSFVSSSSENSNEELLDVQSEDIDNSVLDNIDNPVEENFEESGDNNMDINNDLILKDLGSNKEEKESSSVVENSEDDVDLFAVNLPKDDFNNEDILNNLNEQNLNNNKQVEDDIETDSLNVDISEPLPINLISDEVADNIDASLGVEEDDLTKDLLSVLNEEPTLANSDEEEKSTKINKIAETLEDNLDKESISDLTKKLNEDLLNNQEEHDLDMNLDINNNESDFDMGMENLIENDSANNEELDIAQMTAIDEVNAFDDADASEKEVDLNLDMNLSPELNMDDNISVSEDVEAEKPEDINNDLLIDDDDWLKDAPSFDKLEDVDNEVVEDINNEIPEENGEDNILSNIADSNENVSDVPNFDLLDAEESLGIEDSLELSNKDDLEEMVLNNDDMKFDEDESFSKEVIDETIANEDAAAIDLSLDNGIDEEISLGGLDNIIEESIGSINSDNSGDDVEDNESDIMSTEPQMDVAESVSELAENNEDFINELSIDDENNSIPETNNEVEGLNAFDELLDMSVSEESDLLEENEPIIDVAEDNMFNVDGLDDLATDSDMEDKDNSLIIPDLANSENLTTEDEKEIVKEIDSKLPDTDGAFDFTSITPATTTEDEPIISNDKPKDEIMTKDFIEQDNNEKEISGDNININHGGITINISKDEMMNIISGALKKDVLVEVIEEVIAKNMREIVEEIVPSIAEKYIKAEIERINKDE